MGRRQWRYDWGVEGAEEIIDLLNDMGDAVVGILEEAAEAGGKVAETLIKNNCPVDEGELKNSIKMTKGKSNNKRAYVRISPDTKLVKYAFHVETGHKKVKPRPFARPAIDNNAKKIAQAIDDKIGEVLGRILL